MTSDILLTNPLFLNQNEAERQLMTPYFPLGLLYLASYLRERDFSVEVWRDENGYASLSISVARGCPYGCEWCQDAVHGGEFRLRSPESVAAEVQALKETYQIDRLRVVDDVDGLDREWLEAWAEAAEAQDAMIPFEALYDLERKDVPMLDVRDTL